MAKLCPLLQKDCIQHACEFYVHVIGSNPQTGAQMDSWNCAITWLPILLVENSNTNRQTAKSVQSMRNVFVKALPQAAQERIISEEGPVHLGDGRH